MVQVCNKGPDDVSGNPDDYYAVLERQEAKFFESRPELKDVTTKLGLPELSKALIRIQEDMLRQHMPTFVRQVQTMFTAA